MTPIPLASPDGTVYAYACGACNHVGGTGEALVRVEPGHFAENSRVDAESCCTCFDCGVPLTAEEGRGLNCAACNAKRWAAMPLPDPGECQSVECRIGRGHCEECGSDNDD